MVSYNENEIPVAYVLIGLGNNEIDLLGVFSSSLNAQAFLREKSALGVLRFDAHVYQIFATVIDHDFGFQRDMA